MRDVIILGSTGSIGTQALDVIDSRRDQFRVVGLAAGGGSIDVLAQQIVAFAPSVVAVARADAVDEVRAVVARRASESGANAPDVTYLAGQDGVVELAGRPCDVVLNAITGSAGLLSTLATLAAGTTLALANKESLVIGGTLVMQAGRAGQMVAVDSEHSAFAQALRAGRADEVRRLILTASGGPFRGKRRAEHTQVTPEQAMAHPTWNMGRVITINSSTLVNKGLELLEAGLLYDVDLDAITVTVHPQSIVHSAVEFHDGSTIAQCSPPDMKLPIALGMAWPNRVPDAAAACDWSRPASWTFEPLDNEAFPAVELARRCGKLGGTAPAVYNAANEACVDAFCDGRIGFLDIVDTIAAVVDEHVRGDAGQERSGARVGSFWISSHEMTVEDVLAADAWARLRAAERCGLSPS